MIQVSEAAGAELEKVLKSDNAKGKQLFVNFAGFG